MIRLAGATALVALLSVVSFGQQRGAPAAPSIDPAVQAAIDHLGSFDYPTRRDAARSLRRANPLQTRSALTAAAYNHTDQYVRYRALVLLTGFGEIGVSRPMRELIADKNDRVRTVVYEWFEYNPSRSIIPALLDAVPKEPSPFVRPSLLRALAAQPDDPAVKNLLTRFVMQGEDVFRGATIVALGDYRRTYATKAIVEVAKLDGPLQADAVAALGRMKDASAASALAEIRRSAPAEIIPLIVADECLLGFDCDAREKYLVGALRQNEKNAGRALGLLALDGRLSALAALLDAGISSRDDAREAAALEVGIVALRAPAVLVETLAARANFAPALDLLGEGFELLASEDFLLERFYVNMRSPLLPAPAGSARRILLDRILDKLGF
jgi:HEAT repeat protein